MRLTRFCLPLPDAQPTTHTICSCLAACLPLPPMPLKVRGGLPFGRKMFVNKATYVAMVCSIALALLCVYVPGLNELLDARPFKPEVYAVALAGAIAVVAAEVGRSTSGTWAGGRRVRVSRLCRLMNGLHPSPVSDDTRLTNPRRAREVSLQQTDQQCLALPR